MFIPSEEARTALFITPDGFQRLLAEMRFAESPQN
jgi:hypothetical protein